MEFINTEGDLCKLVQEPISRNWFCLNRQKAFHTTKEYRSITLAMDDGLSGNWQRRKQEVPNDTA